MHNGKYISVKRILENVHRNYNIADEVNFFDALEWIGGVISLAESPFTLDKHFKVIQIEDGRGKLPCDLHSIIQCAKRKPFSTALGNAPRTFFMENDVLAEGEEYFPDTSEVYIETSADTTSYALEPMFYSADSFALRYHCLDLDFKTNPSCGNTYQVNKNFIFTNFEEGFVEMAYLRIALDDEGYPLIPDDESWIKMCELEIAYRVLIRAAFSGDQKSNMLAIIERDRDWYFAQAVNKSKIPTQDMANTWQNHALNYIKNPASSVGFFKHIHEPGGLITSRR
jgi:hypothetical protein